MIRHAERFIRPATPHTKSDESIKVIRAWIDECHTRHPKCAFGSSTIKDRQLPSRILKIEQGENLNDLHVKLCDSAHFHPEVQYATLSHAWGRDLHLKLTSKNMEELQQGIPISKLPRTFADAAELTNSLSLRDLWIDALCIIQDVCDKSDWERECSKMCGIYSSAFVSIAASAAVDSDGGLFVSRNPLEITPYIIHVTEKKEGGDCEPYALWPEDRQMKSFLADTPLNQRAWVFQERLLAPRTVHFTKGKIFWECRQLIASDSDPYNDIEKFNAAYPLWSPMSVLNLLGLAFPRFSMALALSN
jgi:Heterokaryon incompatibility protein (HET)